MLNNKTTIFIFSPSEIIYKGLYSTILEIGIDAIHVATLDEFNGYSKTNGHILIILPTNWHKEYLQYLEKSLFNSSTIKFIDYSLGLKNDESIHIDDTSIEIQQKIP